MLIFPTNTVNYLRPVLADFPAQILECQHSDTVRRHQVALVLLVNEALDVAVAVTVGVVQIHCRLRDGGGVSTVWNDGRPARIENLAVLNCVRQADHSRGIGSRSLLLRRKGRKRQS